MIESDYKINGNHSYMKYIRDEKLLCDKCQTLKDTFLIRDGKTNKWNFTPCLVKGHNSQESLWIISNDKVYDITSYINEHPGGSRCLIRRAGGAQDATEDFEFHSKRGQSIWRRYEIGKLVPCDKFKPLVCSDGGPCVIL